MKEQPPAKARALLTLARALRLFPMALSEFILGRGFGWCFVFIYLLLILFFLLVRFSESFFCFLLLLICVEYRAKNGFGGMNSEIAVFFENKISRDTTMWNKKCANQPLKNFKHAKYALDRLN